MARRIPRAGTICARAITGLIILTARLARSKASSSTTATKLNISAPTKTATRASLDGKNHYILHFDKDEIPPTLPLGFWSITMYGSDFKLVKNAINRFSIGDRTKGLTYNPDGSLNIYIQNQAPTGHESQNPSTLGKYLPPIKSAS